MIKIPHSLFLMIIILSEGYSLYKIIPQGINQPRKATRRYS
jgi:hypothetical protein